MPVVVTLTANKTLGDLKARIADELARSDLTSQIALAISDAMSEAATHRFWFNEVRGVTFPLVPGQDYYSSADIDAMVEIDDLYLTIGGQRRNLRRAGDRDVDALSNGTPPVGEPYLWSRYGQGLRFYPTPQLAYDVTMDGSSGGLALEDDGDWNVWTTSGERYVRALAKRALYADVIQDFESAKAQDALAARYREEFMSQTYDRVATGQMACNG